MAPLVVNVNPNVNVVLTACLTVYVGCYRSVKPTPPSVSNTPMYLLAIIVTCNSCDQLNYFCICYYAGDHVQGACYAVPLSWKCYAFITVPSIQVSLKRLGQRCAHCLLFHSRHCCSLVSPFFSSNSFCRHVKLFMCCTYEALLMQCNTPSFYKTFSSKRVE